MSPRRFGRALAAVGLLLTFLPTAPAQKPFDDPVLERMQKDVFFLASPECEGRGVETKGIEKAADYVAEQFKAAGLKPAMKDGSYFQPFTINAGAKLDSTKLVLTGPGDVPKVLKAGTDFTAMGFSGTAKADAGLVFVGYGVTAPNLKYDDYAGVDVEGKVVVMLRRIPRYGQTGDKRFDTGAQTSDESTHAAFATKIENAAKHKAAGVIIVNDATAADPRDVLFQFENHSRGTTPASFPVMQLKRETFSALIASGPLKSVADIETLIDKDLKPRSFELKGWKADAAVEVKRTEYKAKNIVGVLEGNGPLADETVVIGAHYDHVGYGYFGSLDGAKGAGKIHFGADDNASGTTSIIELARRYGSLKERQGRRLVFIAFSGEERGLLGSVHYCKEPLFPLKGTVAMLNLDMVGRVKTVSDDWLGIWENGPKKDRLDVFGTGTSSEFHKLARTASEKVPFKIYTHDAGTGPSDHDSFYRKNVPVLFLFSGYHPEYHRPTDVPAKINVPGMKKVADFSQVIADHFLTVSTRPDYKVVHSPTPGGGPKGPRLGVLPDYDYEGDNGMKLQGVSPGGPAEKGGLKEGDLVIEIGGKPVKNVGGYMTAMGSQKAGTPIEIIVMRKGQKVTLKVTPE